MVFLQLGDIYSQVDIVNSRIWFAIHLLNMSREKDRMKRLDLEHKGMTNRLKLKLSKKDTGTGVHMFINKMSPFNSLKEIIDSRKKKRCDILTEEMIDNSLCSQGDSGSSDQDESTEFDTVETIDTVKSN